MFHADGVVVMEHEQGSVCLGAARCGLARLGVVRCGSGLGGCLSLVGGQPHLLLGLF